MVLVGGATRGFPEGAAPPRAAIFTRGSAGRPAPRAAFPRFDQSKTAPRKKFCWGFSPLFFLGRGLFLHQVPGMCVERES